jgi:hypothetical protein
LIDGFSIGIYFFSRYNPNKRFKILPRTILKVMQKKANCRLMLGMVFATVMVLVSAGWEKMQIQQAQAKGTKTTVQKKKAVLSRDLKDAQAEPEKIELQQASTLAQKLLNPSGVTSMSWTADGQILAAGRMVLPLAKLKLIKALF